MSDLLRLTEKILDTIQRDVDQLFIMSGRGVLAPEHQEALARYLKLLTDSRIEAKERELDEKIKRAEEVINRGAAKAP